MQTSEWLYVNKVCVNHQLEQSFLVPEGQWVEMARWRWAGKDMFTLAENVFIQMKSNDSFY